MYIALCVYHPKSNLLPSPYIWLPFFTLYYLLFLRKPPYCCLCLWVLVVLSCLIVSSILHFTNWVKSYGSWLFKSDLFRLVGYSQDSSMLSQIAVSHLSLWLSSLPLAIPLWMCPISSVLAFFFVLAILIILLGQFSVLSCVIHLDLFVMEFLTTDSHLCTLLSLSEEMTSWKYSRH